MTDIVYPTVTFVKVSTGRPFTIALYGIIALKKNTNNITEIWTDYNDIKFYDIKLAQGSVKELSDMINYSQVYANEWNKTGVEPKHMGKSPYPDGA